MLITLLSAAVLASCNADTAKRAPTLADNMHVAALHIDGGGATATENGDPRPMFESRLAVAFCRWPSLTMAVVGGGNAVPRPTTYVAPGSQFHPYLYVTTSAVEIQKRWRDSSLFRPMAALAVGSLHARYLYWHRDSTGNRQDREDGPPAAGQVTSWVGLETSLFRYMTIYALAGVRHTAHMDFPGLEGSFSGSYVSFGVGLGKFR